MVQAKLFAGAFDHLLAYVAYEGRAAPVAVDAADAPPLEPGLSDLLHLLTGGNLVLPGASAAERAQVLRRLGRPQEDARLVTASMAPGDTLLCVCQDGSVRLKARPLTPEDSGAPVRRLTLDAAGEAVQVELEDGQQLRVVPAAAPTPVTGEVAAPPRVDAVTPPASESATRASRRVRKAQPGKVTASSELGQRIRAARKQAKLTQQELATRAGMHRPNLARIESGKHKPSAETLERLAAGLGIAPASL